MENKSGTIRSFDVHAGQMSSGVSQVSTGRSRKTQLSFPRDHQIFRLCKRCFSSFADFTSFSVLVLSHPSADLIRFISLRLLFTTPGDRDCSIRLLFLILPPLPQHGLSLCDDHFAAVISIFCYFPPVLIDAVGII